MLAISRGADRVGDGFDMVFGEDRTRPGDGFSKERAGKRAGDFTRQARENNRDKTSGFMDKNSDRDFFGKSGDKKEDDREWF